MSDTIELLRKEYPHRAFALRTSTHVLTLEHTEENGELASRNGSSVPRCAVEFTMLESAQLDGYRTLKTEVLNYRVHGTLGLITLNNDIFLCVVSSVSPRPITIRPGETVRRIESVDFHCLSSTAYDRLLNEQVNPYVTDHVDEEGFDNRGDDFMEHPCMALKKLLSSGTFYYSSDFDLTRRLQKRITDEEPSIAYESFDAGFLWNSFMIQPLIDFRSRLSHRTRDELDASRILTSVIRGYCSEMIIPAPSAPVQRSATGEPTRLTIISRLSCRRAGTRFNARGIDDEGNVANFVETELTLWSPVGEDQGEAFSYIQVRGSLPIFWEQASSLNPLQQPKISITRSAEATQPAFDKHFQNLDHSYGVVQVVNLLSKERKKPGEIELTQRYEDHIRRSGLNNEKAGETQLLTYTHYDFHAETKGPQGISGANSIVDYIGPAARSFGYLYAEDFAEHVKIQRSMVYSTIRKATPILQQDGVFRTNCLDCLDRTNYVQTLISQLACEFYLEDRRVRAPADFWARHSTLWADNGDALSRMYAGTGALNTSATRHGKLTIGGILSDARKSASRLYINNFADKGRQNTIDMLLGRLMGQQVVHLYDPINDWVQMELRKRANEYMSGKTIGVYVGTMNLNGKLAGLDSDLSPWLCPPLDRSQKMPEIVAVAFQEIVELNPQQLMKEDPHTRLQWEKAVQRTLNEHAAAVGGSDYVLLRSGQLVGAALLIFAQKGKLKRVRNVEGAIKKTGLSGMAGNKGAVAMRMDYANTSLCFVTAHLAAGFSNYEDRNRDYRTISQGLRFQRNRTIDDHDSVFWFGDFNYRIGLGNEKVRMLIDRSDLDTLLENDQLYIQRTRSSVSNVFDHYDEAKITFLPTYKFDLGTDTYDTSEKGRIPAWTDRVLRKGNNIRQINYNSAPLRFSDHRPVYASFEVDVSLVDEKHRDELNISLYKKRKADVSDGTVAAAVPDTDEEDLLGFEPVQSGWPPASSDRQKWWLDNSQPAYSTLKPPGKGYVPNPSRSPNPFAPSDEPDWVKVESVNSSANVTRSSSVASRTAPRKLPPSFDANGSSPHLPPRRTTASENAASTHPSLSPSPSVLSISSATSAAAQRKPAPPIKPKKPSLLGTPASPISADGTSERRFSVGAKAATPPSIPPPRRSMAVRGGPPTAAGHSGDDAPPPLPSRTRTGLSGRSSAALMDETDDGAMNGLNGWEVLRPG